jgi:hypothetical protein
MLINVKPQSKRAVNLINAVRAIGAILPGDRIQVAGEKPATYIGSSEEGDIQVDYIQLHFFKLHDGVQVIVEAPSLNRSLGKLIY